jgi:protein TonB
VIEGGKLSFEPTEVTYRTITYYLDENLARMVQPGQMTTVAPTPSTAMVAQANAKPESVKPSGATNSNKESASLRAQPTTLPAANTFDKTNMISASNRGGQIPGSTDGARASSSSSSTVVAVDDAGEPPSPTLPKPLTKPVSGGVLNGSATALPKPDYPAIARHARASGIVSVEVVIDETGKVISARAASGHPLLREAAVKAATRALFTPTKLSGQPVKVSGVVNYNFSFDQ